MYIHKQIEDLTYKVELVEKLVSGQCSHTISVSSSDILPRPPGKLGHPFPHPALLYIGEKKLLQKCECFV